MLHLPSPDAATLFCQNIGLPINSNDDGNRVVMKAAPISIDSNREKVRQLINPGRDEDNFVFSSYYDDWLGEGGKKQSKNINDEFEGMSSLQRAMAKARISQNTEKASNNVEDTTKIDDEWIIKNCDCQTVRVDQDGIKVPPSHVIRKLIFL